MGNEPRDLFEAGITFAALAIRTYAARLVEPGEDAQTALLKVAALLQPDVEEVKLG